MGTFGGIIAAPASSTHSIPSQSKQLVQVPIDDVELEGELTVPDGASGLVVFAHGSGSSRHSPCNNYVADVLREHGLGTLLFDFLTEAEDRRRETRFDITLLMERLLRGTDWIDDRGDTGELRLGYIGSSTGAAAALRGSDTGAVVSRGGRVDMASEGLGDVEAATLFIVGGANTQVLELNREAFDQPTCEKELSVVEGAGHFFEAPGELEEVAELAAAWFEDHLS